jgi:C4-type Zn-finger protein
MARVLSDGPVGEKTMVCPSCHYRIGYVPSDVWEDEDRDKRMWCPKCKQTIGMPTRPLYDPSDYDL